MILDTENTKAKVEMSFKNKLHLSSLLKVSNPYSVIYKKGIIMYPLVRNKVELDKEMNMNNFISISNIFVYVLFIFISHFIYRFLFQLSKEE